MLEVCGWPMSGPDAGQTCGRPAGHTGWSIEAGWPRDTVTACAHSVKPQPYDAEVAPYLTDGTERIG